MRRWNRSFAVALAGIAALTAFATERGLAQASAVVAQKDIAFSPARIEIKAGTTVTFVNEDPFGHNVYSETKGGEFDIGRQQPSQRSTVTFRNPGTFIAECRIHPKMRLEIVVTP
jgi:plastocyanin